MKPSSKRTALKPAKARPRREKSDLAAMPVIDKRKTAPRPAPEEVAPERIKLVRDSFTMPRDEFELIAKLKARALEFKRPTKKSELLRAGLQQLAALDEARLRAALASLRPLKTGRPKKKR